MALILLSSQTFRGNLLYNTLGQFCPSHCCENCVGCCCECPHAAGRFLTQGVSRECLHELTAPHFQDMPRACAQVCNTLDMSLLCCGGCLYCKALVVFACVCICKKISVWPIVPFAPCGSLYVNLIPCFQWGGKSLFYSTMQEAIAQWQSTYFACKSCIRIACPERVFWPARCVTTRISFLFVCYKMKMKEQK